MVGNFKYPAFGKKVVIFCAVLFSFISILNVQAASGVPTIFSYQGRLANLGGNLLGGAGTTYYFKFSIWNVATGGTQVANQVWPSSSAHSVPITVRQGVFNVNIGDTANGYPDVLDYNFGASKDVFLQVEVSDDGVDFEAITPRHRIASAVFAQVAGAVSGVGQSSFGTTNPAANTIVTIEAPTASSIPALIRGASGQSANLLRIEDSTFKHLLSIDAAGGLYASSTFTVGTSSLPSFIVDQNGRVGVGTGAPSRKFNVFDVDSSAQLRLSQSVSNWSEFYVDSVGDAQISSTGGNIRLPNENMWVCSGGSCDPSIAPAGGGNMVVETAIILNNKFKLKQVDSSTTVMYDSAGNDILEFDESR